MERKGAYNKGHEGHPRSGCSPYKIGRQKYKKWKAPFVSFMALLLVFGLAPLVGEQFQTSVLTSGETREFIKKDPIKAQKTLLNVMNDFVKDCDRFNMADCVVNGKAIIHDIVNAGDNIEVVFTSVQRFSDRYEEAVVLNACKYDLGEITVNAKAVNYSLGAFLNKYGDSFDSAELSIHSTALKSTLGSLDKFVESCTAR